jgi:hypothetical protein
MIRFVASSCLEGRFARGLCLPVPRSGGVAMCRERPPATLVSCPFWHKVARRIRRPVRSAHMPPVSISARLLEPPEGKPIRTAGSASDRGPELARQQASLRPAGWASQRRAWVSSAGRLGGGHADIPGQGEVEVRRDPQQVGLATALQKGPQFGRVPPQLTIGWIRILCPLLVSSARCEHAVAMV